ncbi:MAG: helix-turn-helix transcriptional regulator [Methylophilaceae bacterium]
MLHKALKLIRRYHQLNQTELAEKLVISNSYLCEIEKGIKSPNMELLTKYSLVFKMPVSNILLFSEKINASSPSDKVRAFAATKVIRLLDWIAETEDVATNA